MSDARLVELVEGSVDAACPLVEGVIGRRRARVVASGYQCFDDLWRAREGGVARLGPFVRRQRCFQMTDRQVSGIDHGLDIGQLWREIHRPVAVVPGLVPQPLVEQNIPGRYQRERPRVGGRCGCW